MSALLKTSLLVAAVLLAGSVVVATNQRSAPETRPAAVVATAATGDEIAIPRDADGHFRVEAEINGRPVKFLIDTGASHVVLSSEDAESAGIRPQRSDFTGSAMTANGAVQVAPLELESVAIGPLEIEQVAAIVNGSDLQQSLLGMSFLNRLGSYRVEGDRLILSE